MIVPMSVSMIINFKSASIKLTMNWVNIFPLIESGDLIAALYGFIGPLILLNLVSFDFVNLASDQIIGLKLFEHRIFLFIGFLLLFASNSLSFGNIEVH